MNGITEKRKADVIELQAYPTLHGQKRGRLIDVRVINNPPESFNLLRLAVPSSDHRKLKLSAIIQLIFIGDLDVPFYTLINYEGWLKEFYSARIGKLFKIRRLI